MLRTIFVLCLASLSACQCERFFAADVGNGVARLAVRNAGIITQLVNDDSACGFASDNVEVTTEGSPGTPGIVRYTVRNCRVGSDDLVEVHRNCNGDATRISGFAVVHEAIREVAGTLTGDVQNPVIPASADAVSIHIRASAENWHVEQDANPAWMTNRNGDYDFTAKPRLAVGQHGVCSVPTPNVVFSELRLTNADSMLQSDGREFPVEVKDSEIEAAAGVGPSGENTISGQVVVWDSLIKIDPILDERYQGDRFLAGYANDACLDGQATDAAQKGEDYDRLQTPVSFVCAGVDSLIADGAARLLVQMGGRLASLVDDDTSCGFASVAPVLSGDVGGPGTATWTVEDCTIDLGQSMILDSDCSGDETSGRGVVVVSASKILTGWRSGDVAAPIVPLDDNPAAIELSAHFTDFAIGSAKGELRLTSGELSARVEPRTALAEGTGACAIPTAAVRVGALTFTGPTEAKITSPQGVFATSLTSAALDATSGNWDRENHIEGTIDTGGEHYDIAALPSGNSLDTTYDRSTFENTFSCTEGLASPLSHTCDFEPFLAKGVAALSTNAFAKIATAIDADTGCGFAAQSVLGSATVDEPNGLGRDGATAVLTVQDCVLDFTTPVTFAADCNGNATTFSGQVVVSGSKTLVGISTGDSREPIVPTSSSPAAVELSLTFRDLTISESARPRAFTLHSGTLSGTAWPRTALDDNTGACSLPTLRAELDLSWLGGLVTVISSGQGVAASVDSANFTAASGNLGSRENELSGTLSMARTSHDISGELDPDYDAATFADAYLCTPGLSMPQSEDDCSFTRSLGQNIARLIVQSAGEVVSVANDEGGCAFDGFGTKLNPTEVTGDSGEQGTMRFRIEDCRLGDGQEARIATDCNGIDKMHRGQFVITADRLVTGERETIFFNPSIVPDTPESVTVYVDDVSFEEFAVLHRDGAGNVVDPGVLTILQGHLSVDVYPKLSENAGDRGAYDVATPVSGLEELVVGNMNVRLDAEGKTFIVNVGGASLRAFNGSYGGRSNELSGSITIDGEDIALGELPLNPDFDQAAFDAEYACNEDLANGPLGDGPF